MLPIQRRAVEFVVDSVRQWLPVCDQFLSDQRPLFLEEPAAHERLQHRLALAFIIRTTRTLLNGVCDPDFPDHSIAHQLEIRLRLLEESWSLFYDPMAETEADAIIARVFPDER